jgi:hypothetical protein
MFSNYSPFSDVFRPSNSRQFSTAINPPKSLADTKCGIIGGGQMAYALVQGLLEK